MELLRIEPEKNLCGNRYVFKVRNLALVAKVILKSELFEPVSWQVMYKNNTVMFKDSDPTKIIELLTDPEVSWIDLGVLFTNYYNANFRFSTENSEFIIICNHAQYLDLFSILGEESVL